MTQHLIALEQVFITILFWAALASSALFLLDLAFKQVWAGRVAIAGMAIALVCSTASMVIRYIYAGYPPLSNLFESLIFFIFAVLLIYLIVQFTLKPRYFGVAAAPLVTLLIGFASILPPRLKDAHPLMPSLQSYWLNIHVTLMLLSYAAFTLALGSAIIYLVLYYTKGKNEKSQGSGDGMLVLDAGAAGGTKVGSQLTFFDDLTYRLILAGFPILAFGIIAGGIWANHAWGSYWSWDPKETWALITWLIYAGYLHFRLTREWKDQKAAWMAVLGFVSVLITYLGVNYLSHGLHTYGRIL